MLIVSQLSGTHFIDLGRMKGPGCDAATMRSPQAPTVGALVH